MTRAYATGAALALLLIAAPAAIARPTVSVAGDTLSIAGDGTPATMVVRPVGGGVEVTGADPGAGCVESAEGASCPTSDTTALQAALSAADESLRVEAPFASASITGGDGADTIAWAATSAASVLGGAGADRLSAEGGGAGAVTLDGQGDDDHLSLAGRTGSGDTAIGGPGTGDTATYAGRLGGVRVNLDAFRNDGAVGEGDLVGVSVEVVIGTAAADTLTSPDDRGTTFDGGLGVDTIDGRGGVDTLSYDLTGNRPNGVRIDLQAGQFAGDRVTGMENLTGSAGPDVLAGTAAAQRLDGAGGDDVLQGRFGADALVGGEGRDTVSFEDATVPVIADLAGGFPGGETYAGIEALRGGPLDDELRAAFGDETLDGGGGADLLRGRFGTDTYVGGPGRDTVTYDDTERVEGGRIGRDAPESNLDGEVVPADVEVIHGTDQSDTIVGGPAADRLEGGRGLDRFLTGPGADSVDGGPNTDVLSFADQPGGTLIRLLGERRAAEFREGDTAEEVEDYEGSPGADEVNVADDRRSNGLRFGPEDLVSYRGRTDGVRVSPGTAGLDGSFSPPEFDDVRAGTVEGTESNDAFRDDGAELVPNRYIGLGGGDNFSAAGVAGPGVTRPEDTARDVFDGGGDHDTLFWEGPAPAQLSLVDGTGNFNDQLIGLESLIGGDGNDRLEGNAVQNNLHGRGGDDELIGDGGDDLFVSEPGADRYVGGEGFDDLNLAVGQPGQVVTPEGFANDGFPGERDNVSADVESIFGTDGDDKLTGTAGGRVFGRGGNDEVRPPPAPAPVRVLGGPGVDTLVAGGRSETGLNLRVTPENLLRTFEGMEYSGFENLTGGAGPDTLTGAADANELRGGRGNDTLDGGDGADLVLGGAGADAIADNDLVADRLGGHSELNAGNGVEEEGAQAEATAPGSLVSITKFTRDDRLVLSGAPEARQVEVNLTTGATDRNDLVSDIETVIGSPRADRISGDGDENTLNGGGGDDIIRGAGNNDRVSGGDGLDRVSDNSAERDSVRGGADNDSVFVVDAAKPVHPDAPACEGGGFDELSADLVDPVPADCEALFDGPVGQHPLTRVRAIGTRVGRRGRVRVRVSCPRASRRTCRGIVSLERGLLRRAKPVRVARRAYRLRAGRSVALRLRLDRTARRALARRGRLNLRLAARERDAEKRVRESSVPVRLRRR